MVSIYQGGGKKRTGGKQKARSGAQTVSVKIDSWDPRGRGICRTHQPILFVDGALPDETCQVAITQRKKQVCEGHVVKVTEPATERQSPFCPIYSQCGGCQLQHVQREAALSWRQQALDSQLRHTHQLTELNWVAPVESTSDEYRRKTRFAIDARKSKPFALGYRAPKSDTVVNVTHCPVLEPDLNAILPALRKTVEQLDGRSAIGHVSLLKADNGIGVTLRCTRLLSSKDRECLTVFAEAHELNLYLDNDDSNETLYQPEQQLRCATTDGLSLNVTTEDFIQVNSQVNLAMINQALGWLAPKADHKVLDLFSGLGNFSLPLAKRCARVTAVEGVATMVQRAQRNALEQGINNVQWCTADLSAQAELTKLAIKQYDKVLLDPSREGAFEACQQIARAQVGSVVYVSCNPATFNRDLAPLLSAGYQISKIGIMEMFPYTQHIETMALIERIEGG